jgi:saccharopine dehydrogenase-like NADP-dependent oxidoreductase
MAKIGVIGAGMVGSVIAQDLAAKHEVTSADISAAALERLAKKGIKTQVLDSRDPAAIKAFVQPFDLIVSAVPGFMGFATLRTLIEAGKDVSDISFFPENSLELDALATQKGVRVITDVGVAPGMDNVILGQFDKRMKVTRFECLVGGLPQKPERPFLYKAPFSPIDVIEEYTRPARLQRGGKVVTLPALTEREMIKFDKPGELEAFNTDGLRSLLFTMSHIPDMSEKTLRYPGHIALIEDLKQSGFFGETPVDVKGAKVVPLDVTARLLIDQWKLKPGEPELTVMRITVEGEEQGQRVRHVWDMYDEFDPKTRFSSMSRTTGFTCAAAANLLLDRTYDVTGVHPPEHVGAVDACYSQMLAYLAERGVHYKQRSQKL